MQSEEDAPHRYQELVEPVHFKLPELFLLINNIISKDYLRI